MELRDMKRSGNMGQYVSSLPFVWNKFEQSGYVTLYAEDQPNLGTFQTNYHGFEDPPVNHYMRPFWIAMESPDFRDFSRQPNCLFSKPKHQYILDYIGDLFGKYPKVGKFAYGYVSDYNHTALFDRDLKDFLSNLHESGKLSNTLLVVMGDHGSSYGNQRETFEGMLNERLPYLSMSFPESFQKKYPDLASNLRKNKDRLTSAFDVHQTLLNLLDISSTKVRIQPFISYF